MIKLHFLKKKKTKGFFFYNHSTFCCYFFKKPLNACGSYFGFLIVIGNYILLLFFNIL